MNHDYFRDYLDSFGTDDMPDSITDGRQSDDEDPPEQEDHSDLQRQEDLDAVLRDIASIRRVDFFAHQAE